MDFRVCLKNNKHLQTPCRHATIAKQTFGDSGKKELICYEYCFLFVEGVEKVLLHTYVVAVFGLLQNTVTPCFCHPWTPLGNCQILCLVENRSRGNTNVKMVNLWDLIAKMWSSRHEIILKPITQGLKNLKNYEYFFALQCHFTFRETTNQIISNNEV